MQTPTSTTPTPQQKLARLVWLAFQASYAVGMGFLHSKAAAAQTEETIATDIGEALEFNTDYYFGRMMKTGFSVSTEGNLSVEPETPRPAYQSWAFDYPTAAALITATEASFT